MCSGLDLDSTLLEFPGNQTKSIYVCAFINPRKTISGIDSKTSPDIKPHRKERYPNAPDHLTPQTSDPKL